MTPKHTLAFAATLLTAGVASAQTFTEVPGAFSCNDITPDGAIVCGSGGSGAYYWDWKNDATPTYVGGTDAVAISDDGLWLAGNMPDPTTGANVAARYDVVNGTWESLGFLPNANPAGCPSLSTAYDISGDGQRIVGLSWDSCDGRAFYWDASNPPMQELAVLGSGQNRASVISGDGTTIGGFGQGSCRTAGQWASDTTGFEYDVTSCSEVFGTTEDGGTTVGIFNSEGFYKIGAGPVTTFGSLIPGYGANATDINEAGTRIVGFDSQLLDRLAWVYEPGVGFTNLFVALTNAGVPGLPVFGLSGVTSCDDSGETMTGWTQFGGCWIVEYPICDGGTTNRCQTASNSVDGTGAFMASSGSLSISGNDLVLTSSPVPNQNGLHYFGNSLLNGDAGAPFGNGWRCVGPSPVFRLPISQASGNVLTTAVDFTTAPASVITAGSTWYFQGWYRDPAAGGEQFNLSDALEISFCD